MSRLLQPRAHSKGPLGAVAAPGLVPSGLLGVVPPGLLRLPRIGRRLDAVDRPPVLRSDPDEPVLDNVLNGGAVAAGFQGISARSSADACASGKVDGCIVDDAHGGD